MKIFTFCKLCSAALFLFITGIAAGYDLNAAGYELPENTSSSTTTGNTQSNVVEYHDVIDVNYNVSLDLRNVPGHINTTQLLNVMQDKSFLER